MNGLSPPPAPPKPAASSLAAITGYWRWWVGELEQMLPAGIARAAGFRPPQRLIAAEGNQIVDAVAGGAVGTIDPRREQVLAVVPAADVIFRRLTLPAEAAAQLRSVVAFELERLTPFRSDDLVFDCRIVGRSATERRIEVETKAVPRALAERTVATLAASGYGAEGLVAVDGDRVTARFDDVAGLVAAPASRGRRFRFLVSAAALLVVLGAYLPLYRIESATDRIEREAALLQRTGEANPGTAPLAIIAAAKSTAPSPLAILNRLSGGLPDGTWLTQLTLAGNDLTIEGRTPTAASLVRIVENIAGFGTVSYVAPVTRDPSGEGERFAFALKVAGERQ